MGIEVIAEIGINHNGDMKLATDMIWIVKGMGADVAKFQIYDPMRVLGPDDPDMVEHRDILLKTELTRDQVIMLKEECDKANIEFLASVFRPEVVGWTEAIGMKRYKIASRSIYDEPLAKAIGMTGKPVIISYGMWEPGKFPAIFKYESGPKIGLYCISKYPTPLKDVEFIDQNGSIFKGLGRFFGFSDHSEGIIASVVAMSLGAKVIEKHVTLSKDTPGPDHHCSITFEELRQLCIARDEISEILR